MKSEVCRSYFQLNPWTIFFCENLKLKQKKASSVYLEKLNIYVVSLVILPKSTKDLKFEVQVSSFSKHEIIFKAFHWGAVVRRYSVKKVLLKISQKPQENTYVRESFSTKLRAWGLQLYLKRDPGTGVFLWILRNFLQLFIKYLCWLLLSWMG